MVENVDVEVSGRKNTCSLTNVPVVESDYSIISRKVVDQIGPFEVRKMIAPWTSITVDVAKVDIEIQNKKERFWVVILDGLDTFVGTGTLAELGIQNPKKQT
jgi:predicted aspartyl protease